MTGYLLDISILSEPTRPRPEPKVLDFLMSARGRAFVSVLTIGELRKGAAQRRRTDPASGAAIDAWVTSLEEHYAERVIDVDLAIAELWGRLSAERPRAVTDTLIAATALTRGLVLVTRNTRDVADTGVRTINPWL